MPINAGPWTTPRVAKYYWTGLKQGIRALEQGKSNYFRQDNVLANLPKER